MMGVGKLTETTLLFADMSICSEILHCTHEEFSALPRVEKKKLRLYVRVHNEKLNKEIPGKKSIVEEPPSIDGPDLQKGRRSNK